MTLVEARSPVEDELRRRIAKLERINASLMTHVERVTDQHEGAYSLFQTAIMLDGRVRSRTEELTGLMHRLERSNQALEAAKNEAETANRSKTRFLAAASHDLLQPLNAARLSVSTLVDMKLGPAATPVVRAASKRSRTSSRRCSTSPSSMPAWSSRTAARSGCAISWRRSRRGFGRPPKPGDCASPCAASPTSWWKAMPSC